MDEFDKRMIEKIKLLVEQFNKENERVKHRVNYFRLVKGEEYMSNKPNLSQNPKPKRVPPLPSQDQEAVTVTPEMLLAQIVNHVGEEFVIIPTAGWINIVDTIQKSEDEGLAENLEKLGVPVIPVSLAPKKEESLIVTPDGKPADTNESGIILPG